MSQLIHTSTSEVYGTPKKYQLKKTTYYKPQSPYAASKIAADHLVMSYYKSFELPAVIIRPFNNFGPRQSNRAVIPTIINQALKSNCKEIKIGSIKPTRDFLFIDDNINAYLSLINKQKVKEKYIM